MRLETGSVLPRVQTFDVEDPGVLHGAVQYRAGAQLRADPQVPLVWLELRDEYRRAAALVSLQYLKEVHSIERVFDRHKSSKTSRFSF